MNRFEWNAKILSHVPVQTCTGEVTAIDPTKVLGISVHSDVQITDRGVEEIEGTGSYLVVMPDEHVHTKDKAAVLELLLKCGLPLRGMTYTYGKTFYGN